MSAEEEIRLVHYVLTQHGHVPDELGRYCCPVPPHVDQNPSANVRIGDMHNDAILGCFSHPGRQKAWTAAQLLSEFEGIDAFKAIARVEEYREAMHADGWVGPAAQNRSKQRLDENILRIRREMAESTRSINGTLDSFMQQRPDLDLFGVNPSYLRETWKVTDGHPDFPGEIYIPYLRTSLSVEDGEVVSEWQDLPCAKHRRLDGKPFSVAGSDFSGTLYGEHLDTGEKDVLLCEGETDVWAAHCAVGSQYDVLGLPTGAKGPTPEQLALIGARQVFIAFDNDDAGNNAALLWKEALPLSRRLKLPIKSDICSLGPAGFLACEVLDEPYAIDMMEFLSEPDPEWMIDGMIIQGGGIGQIIGASTAGKTFVALDLAMSVCGKDEWLGHKIRTNGNVIYACMENPAGFRKRLRAHIARYGHPPFDLKIVRHRPLNLVKAEKVSEFLDGIRAHDPVMVIIDTQAKATAGMDENSAQEAGLMIEYVDAIARELTCPVILVHHVGYSSDDRPGGRGSSAMFAAMDFVLHCKWNRKTDERTITFPKLKDGEPIAPIGWHIEAEPGVGSAVFVKASRCNLEKEAEPSAPPESKEDALTRMINDWNDDPDGTPSIQKLKIRFNIGQNKAAELREQILNDSEVK